jgi:hypothetical protein
MPDLTGAKGILVHRDENEETNGTNPHPRSPPSYSHADAPQDESDTEMLDRDVEYDPLEIHPEHTRFEDGPELVHCEGETIEADEGRGDHCIGRPMLAQD